MFSVRFSAKDNVPYGESSTRRLFCWLLIRCKTGRQSGKEKKLYQFRGMYENSRGFTTLTPRAHLSTKPLLRLDTVELPRSGANERNKDPRARTLRSTRIRTSSSRSFVVLSCLFCCFFFPQGGKFCTRKLGIT